MIRADMATSRPRVRKQRVRREQVREAQRRRRERLRMQHQRFLQLLVPEDLHKQLTDAANGKEVSVQQLALDLIQAALTKGDAAALSIENSPQMVVSNMENNQSEEAVIQQVEVLDADDIPAKKQDDMSQLSLF